MWAAVPGGPSSGFGGGQSMGYPAGAPSAYGSPVGGNTGPGAWQRPGAADGSANPAWGPGGPSRGGPNRRGGPDAGGYSKKGGPDGYSKKGGSDGFTKKGGATYHGYKMHTATDVSGIVTGVAVSSASDHDSRHIDELIGNETLAVYADSAYSDAQRRQEMEDRGVLPAISHKRVKGQAELDPWQKKFNKLVAKVRAIGEHPYAWMKRLMNFTRCRYRGLRRNTFDFLLTAAAYNVRKAVSLAPRAAAAR